MHSESRPCSVLYSSNYENFVIFILFMKAFSDLKRNTQCCRVISLKYLNNVVLNFIQLFQFTTLCNGCCRSLYDENTFWCDIYFILFAFSASDFV